MNYWRKIFLSILFFNNVSINCMEPEIEKFEGAVLLNEKNSPIIIESLRNSNLIIDPIDFNTLIMLSKNDEILRKALQEWMKNGLCDNLLHVIYKNGDAFSNFFKHNDFVKHLITCRDDSCRVGGYTTPDEKVVNKLLEAIIFSAGCGRWYYLKNLLNIFQTYKIPLPSNIFWQAFNASARNGHALIINLLKPMFAQYSSDPNDLKKLINYLNIRITMTDDKEQKNQFIDARDEIMTLYSTASSFFSAVNRNDFYRDFC